MIIAYDLAEQQCLLM